MISNPRNNPEYRRFVTAAWACDAEISRLRRDIEKNKRLLREWETKRDRALALAEAAA